MEMISLEIQYLYLDQTHLLFLQLILIGLNSNSSSGDVEFDTLTLNGVNSDCVIFSPPSSSSLINNCLDFVSGG